VGRAAAGRLLWLLPTSPWSPLVAALISTAGTLWLTGGFHEDGLADVADGLGGLVPPERALEIMKDSRIGAYGVMALPWPCSPSWADRPAAGVMQPFWGPVPVLILVCCIHVLSRFAPLVLMRSLPHVGLAAASKTLHIAGSSWAGRPAHRRAVEPAGPGPAELARYLPLCALPAGSHGPDHLVGATLAVAPPGRHDGDCLGACQQLHRAGLAAGHGPPPAPVVVSMA
jgi:adenosylcobinamide-GDP ribazoletransferase